MFKAAAFVLVAQSAAYAAHDAGYVASVVGPIPAAGIYRADWMGFYKGECTSYTAYRLNQNGVALRNWFNGAHFSDGRTWVAAARSIGLTVSTTPVAGSVYCTTGGNYGHVAFVESVAQNGTANIAEYNYQVGHQFDRRTGISANGQSSFFIHFTNPRPDAPWGLSELVSQNGVSFDWTTVQSADAYRLHLSTTQNNWNATTGWDPTDSRATSAILPVNQGISGGQNSQYTWVGLIPGMTYYWSVRVNVPGRGASPFTAPRQFTAMGGGNGGNPPQPPQGQDDHGGTRGTATQLSLNVSQNGQIEQSGDADMFRIMFGSAGDATLRSSGSTDVVGELQDANGNVLASNDDSNGTTNFTITSRVQANVNYYLKVTGYSANTGNYGVSASLGNVVQPPVVQPPVVQPPVVQPPVANGDDHGNTRFTATTLPLFGTRAGNIEVSGDADYFRVDVSSGRNVTFSSAGNTDVTATLYDAQGGYMDFNDDSNGTTNFTITRWLNAGTYYIRTAGYNTTIGQYSISAQ